MVLTMYSWSAGCEESIERCVDDVDESGIYRGVFASESIVFEELVERYLGRRYLSQSSGSRR